MSQSPKPPGRSLNCCEVGVTTSLNCAILRSKSLIVPTDLISSSSIIYVQSLLLRHTLLSTPVHLNPPPIYDCWEPEAASAIACSLALARGLFSPCLPFCNHPYVSLSSCSNIPLIRLSALPLFPSSSESSHPSRFVRTSHLANLRSISPLRSAASLLSSLRERRTTRLATAR